VLVNIYMRTVAIRNEGARPSIHIVQRESERAQRATVQQRWRRLEKLIAGHWTNTGLRPSLAEWVARQYGSLSFRLTQVLSGHGSYGQYLYKVVRGKSLLAATTVRVTRTLRRTPCSSVSHGTSSEKWSSWKLG
jgi:hypothetical protein